ncbi:carboxylesterase family protein [Vibrio sp. PP-XX7]
MMKIQQSLKTLLVGTMTFVSLLCSPVYAASSTESNTVLISSDLGKIKGVVHQQVAAFYGVPYAKNPFVEGRRFQAPQPIQSWNGTFDATIHRDPVPQPGRTAATALVGSPGDLTVNIWAPASAVAHGAKQLPVMVWIPGGAFIREDASEAVYNGQSFASNGIIVVTMNYRVGVDGFMHLKGAPDNRGILDQILALQWVKNNIAAFGGIRSK